MSAKDLIEQVAAGASPREVLREGTKPQVYGAPDPKGGKFYTTFKAAQDLYVFEKDSDAMAFLKKAERKGFMVKLTKENEQPAVVISI